MTLFDYYPDDLPITIEALRDLDYERRSDFHVKEKELDEKLLEKIREEI